MSDDIVVPKLQIRAKDGKETLNLDMWNGRVQLTVWGAQGGGGPLFKQSMTTDLTSVFKYQLNKIKEAQPETKLPIVISEWKMEEKKYLKKAVITIGKDERQVIYIDASFKRGDGGKTLRFELKIPNTVALGDEPMKDSTKSLFKVNAILEWFEDIVPLAAILTGKKQAFGNKGGGGGYNNNKSSGNSGDSDFGSTGGGGGDVFG